jgi:1-deoxy-D-xylulose-5-phosphate synthase
VVILNFGTLMGAATVVADKLDATLVDMRFIKPLDETLLDTMADRHTLLVTLEENAVAGGAGSAVSEYFNRSGRTVSMLQLGLPDTFIDHGQHQELLAGCGLDATGIEASIVRRMGQMKLRALQPLRSEGITKS